MTRRTKLWVAGALLFALLNAAGAVFVLAITGGIEHFASHVILAFIGAYVAWRMARPRGVEPTPIAPAFDQRLDRLQHSLDAIAVEVERVGEGQRYVTKLMHTGRNEGLSR